MFFGYFLNTKKVTPSADFVIVPATAGAFLFSHTRLPLSPRPLLPFGRISPAAKPGWPVTGPAFWVCRAKSGAAFRCALPGRPSASRPWLRHPAPLFCRSRHGCAAPEMCIRDRLCAPYTFEPFRLMTQQESQRVHRLGRSDLFFRYIWLHSFHLLLLISVYIQKVQSKT